MPERIPSHKTFTVDEVASYFRVDPSTVWRWIRKGTLPAVRIDKGTTRILRVDLQAFISAHRSRKAHSRAKTKGSSIRK